MAIFVLGKLDHFFAFDPWLDSFVKIVVVVNMVAVAVLAVAVLAVVVLTVIVLAVVVIVVGIELRLNYHEVVLIFLQQKTA